jgi:phage tail sheath protein FI
MASLRIPGVYIAEKSAFPDSAVEFATAVPAFIGWTERAERDGESAHLKPVRITSLGECVASLGGAPIAEHLRFTLSRASATGEAVDRRVPLAGRDATALSLGGEPFRLVQTAAKYNVYFAMLHFF